jgi:hypothetical protein
MEITHAHALLAGTVIGAVLKEKAEANICGIVGVEMRDDTDGLHMPWCTVVLRDGSEYLVAVTKL